MLEITFIYLSVSVTKLSEPHTQNQEEKINAENVVGEIEDDVQGEKEKGQISAVLNWCLK